LKPSPCNLEWLAGTRSSPVSASIVHLGDTKARAGAAARARRTRRTCARCTGFRKSKRVRNRKDFDVLQSCSVELQITEVDRRCRCFVAHFTSFHLSESPFFFQEMRITRFAFLRGSQVRNAVETWLQLCLLISKPNYSSLVPNRRMGLAALLIGRSHTCALSQVERSFFTLESMNYGSVPVKPKLSQRIGPVLGSNQSRDRLLDTLL